MAFEKQFNLHYIIFWLYVKPGIQERRKECVKRREWRECYIPGNVAKHSEECPQTFREMSSNVLGNVAKHSRECRQKFPGMLPNIPGMSSKIIAQLNINSLRNKFDSIVRMLHNYLDILLISETKIDSLFPAAQFQIEDYTTYRLDRNANGGGILVYIREDIPSTLLNCDMSIESFCIEKNIRKKK